MRFDARAQARVGLGPGTPLVKDILSYAVDLVKNHFINFIKYPDASIILLYNIVITIGQCISTMCCNTRVYDSIEGERSRRWTHFCN